MSKKSRVEELQPGTEDWNPGGGGGLVSKPSRGWLHSSEKISGPGVTYIVKYLGCIEVLRSMRSLDFNTRSQITRCLGMPCPLLCLTSRSACSCNVRRWPARHLAIVFTVFGSDKQ
uniref:PID domain-containing protein n=1 Tax=Neogobius melanostomus TaxID=47308 RepID=A0A8C6T7D8_9GOBI